MLPSRVLCEAQHSKPTCSLGFMHAPAGTGLPVRPDGDDRDAGAGWLLAAGGGGEEGGGGSHSLPGAKCSGDVVGRGSEGQAGGSSHVVGSRRSAALKLAVQLPQGVLQTLATALQADLVVAALLERGQHVAQTVVCAPEGLITVPVRLSKSALDTTHGRVVDTNTLHLPSIFTTKLGARPVRMLAREFLADSSGLRGLCYALWKKAERVLENAEAVVQEAVESLPILLEQRVRMISTKRLGWRFDAILKRMPQGVVFIDDALGPCLVNPAAANLLGLPTAGELDPSMVASAMRSMAARSDLSADLYSWFNSVAGNPKDEVEAEWTLRSPRRVLRVRSFPVGASGSDQPTSSPNVLELHHHGPHTHGRVWLFDDVTAERDARDAVEAANRAKSQFLACMSHELRTPLTGVLGMMDLLRLTQLDDEQSQFLAAMQSSAESLLTIINDLLDFSKFEAGHLDLEDIDFDMGGMVREVLALFQGKLLQQKLTLSLDLPPPEDLLVRGDPLRLKQVLCNLLSNSIKFTPTGGVTISVHRLSQFPKRRRTTSDSDDTRSCSSLISDHTSDAMDLPGSRAGLLGPYVNLPKPHPDLPERAGLLRPYVNLPKPHPDLPEPDLNLSAPHSDLPSPQAGTLPPPLSISCPSDGPHQDNCQFPKHRASNESVWLPPSGPQHGRPQGLGTSPWPIVESPVRSARPKMSSLTGRWPVSPPCMSSPAPGSPWLDSAADVHKPPPEPHKPPPVLHKPPPARHKHSPVLHRSPLDLIRAPPKQQEHLPSPPAELMAALPQPSELAGTMCGSLGIQSGGTMTAGAPPWSGRRGAERRRMLLEAAAAAAAPSTRAPVAAAPVAAAVVRSSKGAVHMTNSVPVECPDPMQIDCWDQPEAEKWAEDRMSHCQLRDRSIGFAESAHPPTAGIPTIPLEAAPCIGEGASACLEPAWCPAAGAASASLAIAVPVKRTSSDFKVDLGSLNSSMKEEDGSAPGSTPLVDSAPATLEPVTIATPRGMDRGGQPAAEWSTRLPSEGSAGCGCRQQQTASEGIWKGVQHAMNEGLESWGRLLHWSTGPELRLAGGDRGPGSSQGKHNPGPGATARPTFHRMANWKPQDGAGSPSADSKVLKAGDGPSLDVRGPTAGNGGVTPPSDGRGPEAADGGWWLTTGPKAGERGGAPSADGRDHVPGDGRRGEKGTLGARQPRKLLEKAVNMLDVKGRGGPASSGGVLSPEMMSPRSGSKRVAEGEDGGKEKRVWFEVSVTDTGIGLTKEQQGRLFSAFIQADSSTTRKFGGTGLGLAICKRLVNAMQGQIWVDSKPMVGSTFTFTVGLLASRRAVQAPSGMQEDVEAVGMQRERDMAGKEQRGMQEGLEAVEGAKSEGCEGTAEARQAGAAPGVGAPAAGATATCSVLVAEDNAVNQLLIGQMLKHWGHRVEIVGNGQLAVDLLRERASEFDIVLMDLQMPVMDGMTATKAIRCLGGRCTCLPIYALTADVLVGKNKATQDVGLDGFLAKPINWPKVSGLLKDVCNKRQEP